MWYFSFSDSLHLVWLSLVWLLFEGNACTQGPLILTEKVSIFPIPSAISSGVRSGDVGSSWLLMTSTGCGTREGSWEACVCAQSCPTICDPIDSSLPGSSVHGTFQARILEWDAISYSRGSSRSRDWTCISYVSWIGRWILFHWGTWEARCRVWNMGRGLGEPVQINQCELPTGEELSFLTSWVDFGHDQHLYIVDCSYLIL